MSDLYLDDVGFNEEDYMDDVDFSTLYSSEDFAAIGIRSMEDFHVNRKYNLKNFLTDAVITSKLPSSAAKELALLLDIDLPENLYPNLN